MKFLPLLITLIAVLAGWVQFYLVVIPLLALVNVAIVSGWRRRQLRDTPQRVGEANPIAELGYLFVLNVLIMTAAYFLGYFLAWALGGAGTA